MSENNDKIRVLHFIPGFSRGGIEAIVLGLYQNFDLNRFAFDFLVETAEENSNTEIIRKFGGKIYRIEKFDYKNPFKYKKAIERFFENYGKCDIAHSHCMEFRGMFFLNVAKMKGIKKRIMHAHTTQLDTPFYHPKSIMTAFSKRVEQRYATDFLACSKKAGEYEFLKKNYKKIVVLNNGIEPQKFTFSADARAEVRHEFGIESDFVLTSVGRFAVAKNHLFMIDVLNELRKLRENVKLVLVGDGPLKDETRKKAEELGVADKVLFLGARDDIPRLLNGMDLFLFPSNYEGLGIVAVEAQASGLVTLASTEVPYLAKVSDLMEFLPLSVGAKVWAEKIMTYTDGYARCDMNDVVKNAGFDIRENAKTLENIYLKGF